MNVNMYPSPGDIKTPFRLLISMLSAQRSFSPRIGYLCTVRLFFLGFTGWELGVGGGVGGGVMVWELGVGS